jgi:putative membrane protein
MAKKTEEKSGFRADLGTLVCGFCMGTADIVPGVSGGTVALVLGIYERLVTAISHFDLRLIEHLRQRQFWRAAAHIDLRFLVTLAIGVASGFLVMTVAMNRLLTNPVTRSLTMAAFLGLILGSAMLVGATIRASSHGHRGACLAFGILGAGFAYWLTTLGNLSCDPSYWYVFVCGCVAICAMILPGISGAMILLIMGVYIHLTEIPHNLARGEQVSQGLLTILVFGAGATISLILFSKFLRWLLGHFHALTMAVLCGFMLGALPKLWPFQADLTPEIEKFKYKQFSPTFPDTIDGMVVAVCAVVLAAASAVFLVERYARSVGRGEGGEEHSLGVESRLQRDASNAEA